MGGSSSWQKYHFDDFTMEHYGWLLRRASKAYAFEPFGTTSRAAHVLWRHDIDMSVHRAVALAKAEAEVGVRSTFFFQLHSEFYNLLERNVLVMAKEVLALGHWAGLHFDVSFYGHELGTEELSHALHRERVLLEDVLGADISVFSFHNPEVGDVLALGTDPMAGMVNAYGEAFRTYRYISDSSGYWRFHRLASVVEEGADRLHVVTHPEWWQDTPMSPRQRVARCVEDRARRTLRSYDARLDEMGRANVGATPHL